MTLPPEVDDQTRRNWLRLGILSIALVSLLDYVTGPRLNLTILYAGPVLLLTRARGRWGGILAALVAAGLALAIDLAWAHEDLGTIQLTFLNGALRGAMLVLVAVLFGRSLEFNAHLTERMKERTAALEADFAERKRVEDALRESDSMYRSLFEHLLNGFAYCRMVFEDGKPQDFIYLAVNAAFESQTGLKDVVGKKVSEVIPGIRETDPQLFDLYGRVAMTGRPERFEIFVQALQMWFSVAVYCPSHGHFVAVFDVVTERKETEKRSRERESLLLTTLSSTVDGILVVNNDGKTLLSNKRFAQLWQIPPAVLETEDDQAMLEYVLNELVDPDAFRRKVESLYSSDASEMDVILFKNGQVLERYSVPLVSEGVRIGRVWSFRDVTERMRADAALLESRARLKAIVDGTTDAVYVKDLDGRYQLFNHAAARFTGKTEAEVLGRDDYAIFPPIEAKTVMAREQEPFLEVAPRSYEETVTFANGQAMTFWTTTGPIVGQNGETVGLFGVSRDITARKATEKRLQDMVQEKEALLKEVHHRVKNNLQVIASLLRLESARSEHPETRSVLGEMQGRVRSMALLHEALNRSGTFAVVDLGSYVQRLATESFRALVAAPGAVQLRLNLASVSVEMDQAMPCGLLVNELIANCLEHGFPDGQGGEVLIALQPAAENGNWQLRVSDTGVGLPADFEARRSKSLGLQLVADLAGQLGGTLDIGPAPAALFTVTFPVHHEPPSPDAV